MTKDEILSRCVWDQYDFATLTVYPQCSKGRSMFAFTPTTCRLGGTTTAGFRSGLATERR